MYCHQCGKEVNNGVKFCPYCGTQLNATQTDNGGYQPINHQGPYQQTYVREEDAPSIGFAVLSFFIPIVGIILFIIWNRDYPQKAKSCLKGFVTGMVLYFITICCLATTFGHMASDEYHRESYDHYNAVVETVPYE